MDNKFLDTKGLIRFKSWLDSTYLRKTDIQSELELLNRRVQDLQRKVEALESLSDSTNGDNLTNTPAKETIDNSSYPVVGDKNYFYMFNTEQAIKLSTLINKSGGYLSRVNKVLANTKLGKELGISGIASYEVFQSSKAAYIANEALKDINIETYITEIEGYLKEVS